jgi:hypothetical protein
MSPLYGDTPLDNGLYSLAYKKNILKNYTYRKPTFIFSPLTVNYG